MLEVILVNISTMFMMRVRLYEEDGSARDDPRQAGAHNGERQGHALSARPRQSSVPGTAAEHALGRGCHLYKAEVIYRRGPWRSLEAVEYATLEWVDWFNNRRLLEPIGHVPPAEAEAAYYAALVEPAALAA